ncbi:hypothetical protein M2451_003196 [Dysgonomonas sp. PFB1-18]|uniref:hypothetical protein n=1 Tax=unclassified Dysgonomonas TaxID=2630389 RepID=UPI00247625DB|nr:MULTISPECIES: hypothetical protein [unclassified Dysgonomonas]MDH6310213.1 hypothetical protein [Dysgonomonas sp. PF1-14]MDH6340032.1 hypothetical protein [Dysgonomonas sp. PF1-16]MDH6381861.1 hypothetical protein [Dysgonomonas sp. PFB1-18]MDH6398897.1 hypothetical protein [Dysgonomonas sp. PF1-23]
MNKTDLKQEVEQLLADIDRTHRYSMSRIYTLANTVFNKTDKPQSCASCLIRKVRELRNWLETQKVEEQPTATKVKPKRVNRKKKD